MAGVKSLQSDTNGISLELDVCAGELSSAASLLESGDGGDASNASSASEPASYMTALRCTRTGEEPVAVRFASVDFTGEVSGPMSFDPMKSANTSLEGGPSYAMARYRASAASGAHPGLSSPWALGGARKP